MANRRGENSKPILNIYEYNNTKAKRVLNIKNFEDATMEWLDLIVESRGNLNFIHGFDITIGNIADDNVGETITFVLNGIMRKEDAIQKLKFCKINNQICFNTINSLEYIKFLSSEICLEG